MTAKPIERIFFCPSTFKVFLTNPSKRIPMKNNYFVNIVSAIKNNGDFSDIHCLRLRSRPDSILTVILSSTLQKRFGIQDRSNQDLTMSNLNATQSVKIKTKTTSGIVSSSFTVMSEGFILLTNVCREIG
jgi:hypothetical protein